MVCLYLRVYSIIFYVVRQVVGGSFSPRGGVPLPLWYPAGGAPPAGGFPSLSPAPAAFSFDSAPYPPNPLPRRGRGRLKVYFAGGFAPGTPALNRLRHLQSLPSRYPVWGLAPGVASSAGVNGTHGWRGGWDAALVDSVGSQGERGTGGEELRRLRWSSPPGQGEQVPRPVQHPGCKGLRPRRNSK